MKHRFADGIKSELDSVFRYGKSDVEDPPSEEYPIFFVVKGSHLTTKASTLDALKLQYPRLLQHQGVKQKGETYEKSP